MKVSDYITVGFIAIFVTIIAYVAVNSILGDPKEMSVKFEYLDYDASDLVLPDADVFNSAAINPTVEVYVGTCVDQDQDGVLNEEEKRNCGQDAMQTDTGRTESDYLQENKGLSNEENAEINKNEGYADGTTAQQREEVEESVNEYQRGQNNANNTQDSARQETVSGS